MPVTLIGNMPRTLLFLETWYALKTWRAIRCPLEKAQCGDLLFVQQKDKDESPISHIALIIEADKIFHCNLASKTAVIQSREEFFRSYEQKICLSAMIMNIDPRNTKPRPTQGAIKCAGLSNIA